MQWHLATGVSHTPSSFCLGKWLQCWVHIIRKFNEKSGLFRLGITKEERKTLRKWFKAEVKALFRCTGGIMRERWQFTRKELERDGHGAFAKWFEDAHMSCTWKNWGFRASGVPGVNTNGDPVESWHAAIKDCDFINTNRVMDWKLHGKTIPAMMRWCSLNCTGVVLESDCDLPIPHHTIKVRASRAMQLF